jgi:glucosyl-dolichyl phosphate glucuronosyltransferase
MVQVSAIIPTYNRAESLSMSIDSVTRQCLDDDDYEIIVVDDHSTDRTSEVVEEHAKKSTHTIRYIVTKEAGLHHARHVGAIAAKADILAYTDDDAVCHPQWLTELLKAYEHPEVGCAGGKIIVRWDEKPADWVLAYEAFMAKLDYGGPCRILSPPDPIYGVNFSLRKNVLREIGGFHPDLVDGERVGDGETGLCRDLHIRGIKIAWVPAAVVWHLKSARRHGTLKYMKRSFQHLGVSAVYAQVLSKFPSRPLLLARSTKAFASCCTYKSIALLLRRQNAQRWQSRELTSAYYKGIGDYELQLMYRTSFRELAQKRNWFDYAQSIEGNLDERSLTPIEGLIVDQTSIKRRSRS